MNLKFLPCLSMLLMAKMMAQNEQQLRVNFDYDLQPTMEGLQWDSKMVGLDYRNEAKVFSFELKSKFVDHTLTGLNSDVENMIFGFESFKQLDLELLGKYALTNQWFLSAGLHPQYMDTFEGSITFDNFQWGGLLALGYSWKSNHQSYSLFMGVERGWALGELQYYPVIALEGKLSKSWAFYAGFPETHVQFNWKEHTTFQAFLKWNGLGVTHTGASNDMTEIEKSNLLRVSSLNLGILAKHSFDNHLQGNFTLGYAASQQWSLDIPLSNTTSINGNGAYVGFGLTYYTNWK